jgi:subtilisin family serine protease
MSESKIDPRLRHLMQQSPAAVAEFAERVGVVRIARLARASKKSRTSPMIQSLQISESETAQKVEVLLRCRDARSLRALRAAGFSMHFSSSGAETVVSGEVALDNLEKLNQIPGVVRVEASRQMVPDLDLSRPETRADRLHQADPAVRGKGVMVGVVDGGIDHTHPAFRHANGKTRILFLWDQGGQPKSAKVPYGREYTRAEINAALASGVPLPHADLGAHGTHVAGIAAGNDIAGGGRFAGIAPEADLIVVALNTEAGTTLGRSTRAFDAFTYIVKRARKRPVAINLSQGMNGGGHSGETALEVGLDNLVRQPNVIVIKSAGNEQEWRIHAGGDIGPGQTATRELQVANNDRLNDIVEVWFDGAAGVSVSLQTPGGEQFPFVIAGNDQEFTTQAGNQISLLTETNSSGTGDALATIILASGDAPFVQPGRWKLLLRNNGAVPLRFDAWIERTRRDVPGEQTRFTTASADPTRTISVPGTARRIITVGSYVTRFAGGSPPGQVSSFSSRGPTRYGLLKPEIAAPGEMIVSARSSRSDAPSDPDPHRTPMNGTSMAAPHVAGAAALILSVRPGLTCEQVKQILMQTARRDGLAAGAPNPSWGAGKLDIAAAVDQARTAQFPVISNVAVEGATLSWRTDIPTTAAVRFHTNRLQLQLGRELGSRVNLNLSTKHSLTLAELAPGEYFCEVVAFSRENWWTADDNNARLYAVRIT